MFELNRWAQRAAPLWERADTSVDDRRLARWSEVLGSRELWERRMRSAQPIEAEHGDWIHVLRAVLEQAPAAGAEGDDDGVPFGHAVAPFIRYARRRLTARAGRARVVLAPAARAALEGELREHLGLVASLALGRTFYDFRFAQAPLAAFEHVWSQQTPSTSIYRQFVAYLLTGGWRDVFERYPVLARLMVQSVEQWIENTSRLCQRVAVDLPRLGRHFGECERPIVSISTRLSDRHNGGQSVASLIFANGRQLIYKPRSVRPEIFFNRVLHWINRHGLTLKLGTVRALDRGAYGWMEFVPHRDCEDVSEVSRFYHRAGALLAVLHALGVSDVHYENVIASGEHPVVVDLETLLAERSGSVLGTGFLPRPSAGKETDADASALGASVVQDSGLRFPMWLHPNTDQMTLVDGAPREAEQHRVRLRGKLVPAADHVRELKSGFREAYSCLLEHRQQLRVDPILRGLDRLELRILLRDSATYGQMHLHLLYPEHLEDGIDRSIELEWLARPLCIKTAPSRGRVA
ncbi:MAG: type 2 lanthipeptide synthetase LanM, partial [Vicinamibacterales bacterium]